MRAITQAMLALGFVGVMAVSTTATTKAQEVYFSGPGVGVEITTRPWNHRYSRYDRYYEGRPYAYQYYRGPDRRYSTWSQCPPHYSVQDGVCKPYRGY